MAQKFIPVSQVVDSIAKSISPVLELETLALSECLGRVIVNDLLSPIDVPAHPNSAMDGFAFAFDSLRHVQEVHASKTAQVALAGGGLPVSKGLVVVGTLLAGQAVSSLDSEPKIGQAIRIMTGAVLPGSCDTVVPQEHADISNRTESSSANPQTTVWPKPEFPLALGQNTRARGEDLRLGEPAIEKGRILTASDLGLAASLGLTQLTVRRRLRAAIMSTGDELVEPGHDLASAQIFDSNRFTLHALLTRIGVDVIDLGIVRDDPSALSTALDQAVREHQVDALFSSGGVSVGEADFTKQVLAAKGHVDFWQIAMRPGRPLAFGHLDRESVQAPCLYFGLPGNPVAVMMTFLFFARPALLQMQGAKNTKAPIFSAVSTEAIRKKPGRTEYQRANLIQSDSGELFVSLTGQQGSGVLSSMSRANCLVVLHHDQDSINIGDRVSVVPFDGLL